MTMRRESWTRFPTNCWGDCLSDEPRISLGQIHPTFMGGGGEDDALESKNNLYRCLDLLLDRKAALFSHLESRWQDRWRVALSHVKRFHTNTDAARSMPDFATISFT